MGGLPPPFFLLSRTVTFSGTAPQVGKLRALSPPMREAAGRPASGEGDDQTLSSADGSKGHDELVEPLSETNRETLGHGRKFPWPWSKPGYSSSLESDDGGRPSSLSLDSSRLKS
jgi:hypothetical protein